MTSILHVETKKDSSENSIIYRRKTRISMVTFTVYNDEESFYCQKYTHISTHHNTMKLYLIWQHKSYYQKDKSDRVGFSSVLSSSRFRYVVVATCRILPTSSSCCSCVMVLLFTMYCLLKILIQLMQLEMHRPISALDSH